MDFIPTLVDGGVVLNPVEVCNFFGQDCKNCPDVSVGIHNWLVSTDLNYLIIDFQDEKDVCSTVLAELLQLRKRLGFPFLFVGLMERPSAFLSSYNYKEFPTFNLPEDAIQYLKEKFPKAYSGATNSVRFGEIIPTIRSRQSRLDFEGSPDAENETDSESDDLV
ncbi:MAG: hypothetical protein AB7T49_08540 [Oligoflexales bacterium]